MTFAPATTMGYAAGRIGEQEQPPGSNCQEYSDWQYGLRCPDGGWCDSFASYILVVGGYLFDPSATHGAKGFSFTDSEIEWAKRAGLWRPASHRSRPGDHWIFDWNGDGRTDHVESVEFDDGVEAITIGGNTGNAVARRRRDRRYLTCVVAFSESPQVAPPVDPRILEALKAIAELEHHVATRGPLHLGQSGPEVRTLTSLLKHHGFLARTTDRYNPAVRQAVRNAKAKWHLPNRDGRVAGAYFVYQLTHRSH